MQYVLIVQGTMGTGHEGPEFEVMGAHTGDPRVFKACEKGWAVRLNRPAGTRLHRPVTTQTAHSPKSMGPCYREAPSDLHCKRLLWLQRDHLVGMSEVKDVCQIEPFQFFFFLPQLVENTLLCNPVHMYTHTYTQTDRHGDRQRETMRQDTSLGWNWHFCDLGPVPPTALSLFSHPENRDNDDTYCIDVVGDK